MAKYSRLRPLYKFRWDKADLVGYYFESGSLLQAQFVPSHLLSCGIGCQHSDHLLLINRYYENLVNCLKIASSRHVPKLPINCLKKFWNEDLSRLKQISIDMHNLWRQIGSPKTGVINNARLKSKLENKLAIKQAASNSDRKQGRELGEHLLYKDSANFWKCWNRGSQKLSHNNVMSVGGNSEPFDIAEAFRKFYSNVYVDSSADTAAMTDFYKLYDNVEAKHVENHDTSVTTDLIELCISKLKSGKAAGHDGLVSEHITNCHLSNN